MIEKQDNIVHVLCNFNNIPTLAMFIEAAAQASSAFDLDDQSKIGFLAIAKDIKLLEKVKEKIYIFKLKKEADINTYKQFSFEAYSQNSNVKTASGSFTLVIDG